MNNAELFDKIENLDNKNLVVDVANYQKRTELRFMGLSKTPYLIVKLFRANGEADFYVIKTESGMQIQIITETELNNVFEDVEAIIAHEIKIDWLDNN